MLLYGDDGNPTTVRGEVLRLRSLIGSDVLRTRPYRLDATVDTDFGTVRRALAAGKPAEALRACAGPLLPRSDAPRSARSATPSWPACAGPCWRPTRRTCWPTTPQHPLGRDDLEVHDRLLDCMAPHDRRRPHFAAHRDRLLAADA